MLILEALPNDEVIQLLDSINNKLDSLVSLSDISSNVVNIYNKLVVLASDNLTWIVGIFAVCFISLIVRLIWK